MYNTAAQYILYKDRLMRRYYVVDILQRDLWNNLLLVPLVNASIS